MKWELAFDGIPPGPNERMHYMRRANTTKAWRAAARLKAQALGIPPAEHIVLSAVIRRPRLGVADEDNDRARMKPVQDGLVDAGVVPKDTRGHVLWGTVTEEHGPAGFVLMIEAEGGEPIARGQRRVAQTR